MIFTVGPATSVMNSAMNDYVRGFIGPDSDLDSNADPDPDPDSDLGSDLDADPKGRISVPMGELLSTEVVGLIAWFPLDVAAKACLLVRVDRLSG
uniref:Uncharacterized protein n=1 Tax=Candidatus Kentrum sp. LFY TaxID=2126342 RepID=A0A450UTZ9_9GAMM|nr:MAG: hypothetical protein BECKLFY1418B_GA0070995_10762 [Candidatus Kentron sp. LFY]